MHRFIELKKSLPISFTRELRSYLTKIYQTDSPNAFDEELGELDKLRGECANPSVSVSSINNSLLRYFLQLLDLESRVNLEAADLKVPFAWYNCSAGDDKKIIVSASNVCFEEACVLFNVAASHIQLAGAECVGSSEGLKRACNNYMMAAGIFQHISENLTSKFEVPMPADVSPMSLKFLTKFALAAAQECFVLKGIVERSIKDPMLAKLALATGHMYESALGLGEGLGAGSIFGRYMYSFLLGRSCYYKAVAQTKKAAECFAASRFGEEIARLHEASHLLTRCKEHKKMMDQDTIGLLDTLSAQVIRDMERAIKDNSIIYHESIPAASLLADIGQAVVARPTPVADYSKDPSIPSRPILSRLVPEIVRSRAVEYYRRRNEIAESYFARIRSLADEEAAIVSQYNLPHSFLNNDQVMGLPSDLLTKSNEVRSQGGAEALFSSLNTIETFKSDAREIFKQVEDLLTEEQVADSGARNEFENQWNRPESEVLAKNLHQALDSYRKSFKEAQESDLLLQKEFDESLAGISSLSSDIGELEASIPASTAFNSRQGDSGLESELRSIYDFATQFAEKRQMLTQAIQTFCHDDAIEEVLKNLGEDTLAMDEEMNAFIGEVLAGIRYFDGELVIMEDEQRAMFERLQSTAKKFQDSLSHSTMIHERQTALKTLEEAHRSFTNLSAHLADALRFYSGLLDLLQKLRENARDFTVSREIELGEMRGNLMKRLADQERKVIQASVGSMRSQPAPVHVQPTSQSGMQPMNQHTMQPMNQPAMQPMSQYTMQHMNQPEMQPMGQHAIQAQYPPASHYAMQSSQPQMSYGSHEAFHQQYVPDQSGFPVSYPPPSQPTAYSAHASARPTLYQQQPIIMPMSSSQYPGGARVQMMPPINQGYAAASDAHPNPQSWRPGMPVQYSSSPEGQQPRTQQYPQNPAQHQQPYLQNPPTNPYYKPPY